MNERGNHTPYQGTILLVEDEASIRELVALNLKLEGYSVTEAINGQDALEMARSREFDLCILDIMLPKLSGFDVCRALRREKIALPILFLSAKSDGADRVEGLRIGGDDYLTKPFNLEELLLRVSNLLRLHQRKEQSRNAGIYRFGQNEVNFGTYEVKGVQMTPTTLTKREIDLLKYLISREGEVVSREEILNEVWGEDAFPSTRTIDNYILMFRKYFEGNPKEPIHFQSIRGVGYKFVKA